MDLLAALQAADYAKAQPLIEKVLRYEPSNELMLEYRVVVQRALKRADDHAEDAADDESVASSDSSASSASSASSTSSSDDEIEAKPTTISTEELREDLAAVGLRGTADELRANVGYIRRELWRSRGQPLKRTRSTFWSVSSCVNRHAPIAAMACW